MKFFTKPILSLLATLVVFFQQNASAQTGVLNPNDPIVIYNPASPPTIPHSGTLVKWVKTNRVSFSTTSFKCYFYNGLAFRLKFPKSYQPGVNDGKLYPLYVFFHGIGEKGTIYDNEYQLYHGGQVHMNAVDNGTFDGFLLYPQSSASSGFFGNAQYDIVATLIQNYFIPQIKVDPNRICVDGLSGGGSATWEFAMRYPKLVATILPISAAAASFNNGIPNLKYTPIWQHQGGLDLGPTPATTSIVVNAYENAGANFRYKIYPTLGHNCWDSAWAEPDYYPYMLRAYKSNPWPLFGRTEFCPGDPINVTIGMTPGFQSYRWTKDGLAFGGSANSIVATAPGVYACQYENGGVWSPWSPTPVAITIKAPTVSPNINVVGLMSKVIPALDGNTGVVLGVPTGYATYTWEKTTDPTVLSTGNTLNATSPGGYKVKVTEQFGCSSDFSAPFTVVDANGPNKPDPAGSLKASVLSKTSIELDWNNSPAPQFNETNFEIYQGTQAGGPYKLIAITGPDVVTYTVNGLNSGTKYYYIIRAVNNTSASTASNEANSTTQSDTQAPTAPSNLTITGTTASAVGLSWGASTDDVGVTEYDIYINGIKAYITTQTQFTVYNLNHKQSYTFVVKAKDFANNFSPASNQVSGEPLANGLSYKYYVNGGTAYTVLPNFSGLTPTSTGFVAHPVLTGAQASNFEFLWEGIITIPVSGPYTFRTNSDDGSKLYLGSLNQTGSPYNFTATALVNNDGAHGAQNKNSASVNLTAGIYPIAIAYFQATGGSSITVSWEPANPQTGRAGTSFVTIPDSAFVEKAVVNGQAPAEPSNVTASAISFKQINVSWTDNSNNETGFEIWRSTSPLSGYNSAGTVLANSTSFSDSSLNPSTTYYYKVRAIGAFGESDLVPNNNLDAKWLFNGNFNDSSGNGLNLTTSNNPTFDAADKEEGSASVVLNGTNQSVTIPSTNNFLRTAYSAKTVSFWMKSNNNTGNRIIADLGGSDNGLALRLDQSRLYAGVASGNNRVNFFAAYTSTGWNHVALVYSGNSLLLYVNGVLVGSNTSLPFSSVGTTTNASRIGTTNSSNAFNTGTGFFSGKIDNFSIYNTALSATDIAGLMTNAYGFASATTQVLPPLPNAPSGLLASGVSTSKTLVTWTDNSNNETKFDLYRSANNNTAYTLLATLAPNTVSYADTGLFANAIYYYKVRAENLSGFSNYSNEDSAITGNNPPVLNVIADQYMHFGTQLHLNITATDPDQEPLNVQVTNLPAPGFGSYTSTGNGTGVLSFNSTSTTDQGTYNGITITATDQHGGVSTRIFNLVVNNNYNPVLAGVANVSVNEKQTAQLNLTATDQNAGDVLTWSFTGLPAFVTVSNSPGAAGLSLAPGYADNGTYNVGVRVDDGNHGFDTASFVITVVDVNPNKSIFVNFADGTIAAAAPWNNTGKVPALNDVFANLKDSTGANSGVGIKLTTLWTGINDAGVNTGNNSGIYPDAVLRTSYYTSSVQTVRITGLDVNRKFNLSFLPSRANPAQGVGVVTTYTVGGQSLSVDAANNSTNTASFPNVQPAADSSVTFTVQKATGSTFGYLNSLVIQSIYDDGSAPATPRNLGAQQTQPGRIHLSWIDAAYNETAYEVYRAVSLGGPYTLLNPGGNNANLQQFDDSTINGNTTYYYTVRTVNQYGNSPYSDTVSISTPNASPVLAAIADVSMKTQQTNDISVTATDDPGDIITLTATGLPSFASFTDNGSGSGTIHIAPGDVTGVFTGITITATDDKGAASNVQFKITVTDKNITSVYVNFNQTLPASAPWNNMNAAPNAGVTISGLKDADNNTTGIGLSLVEKWTNSNTLGVVTGNNSGIYPDNVMQTFYYETSTNVKHILLTGLSSANKYNLVFFASRADFEGTLITTYTVGSQTVQLDAANNSTNTVQINGISPDGSGQIQISIAKASSSPNAYLGAMVIQSYPFDGTPLPPQNLTAAGIAKDQISLNWVSGADNTTGYEIWRSSTYGGTYSQIGTVAGNVTTYSDISLPANSVFYYEVRAVVNGVFSPYSNIAGASTVAFNININMNDGSTAAPAQSGPWNNTNTLIDAGFVLPNLVNDQLQNTGIDLDVVEGFAGFNTVGATTGNNSGIVPDNVSKSLYYLNFGDSSILKITGLNQTFLYNFIFFGSRANPVVGVTSIYRIGNQVVQLDATNNTSRTAQINNVKPDATGSVYIIISAAIQGGFGYLNALMIQGMPNVADSVMNLNSNNSVGHNPTSINGATITQEQLDSLENPSIDAISAYPNPFRDDIMLKLDLKQNVDKFTVLVSDMSGRVIHRKEFYNAPAGVWQQPLGLSGKGLGTGVYIIQVYGINNQKPRIFKIVKQN